MGTVSPWLDGLDNAGSSPVALGLPGGPAGRLWGPSWGHRAPLSATSGSAAPSLNLFQAAPHLGPPDSPGAGKTIPQPPRRTKNSRLDPSSCPCPRPRSAFSVGQVLSRCPLTDARPASAKFTPACTRCTPGPWCGRTAVLREPDAPTSKFLVFTRHYRPLQKFHGPPGRLPR